MSETTRIHMLGKGASALAISAILLLLTSCAPATPESPAETSSASAAPSEESDAGESDVTADEVPSGRVDAAAAAQAALEVVPGDVVELELGRERTTIVWEVGVLGSDGSGTEVVIDSASGDVLAQKRLRLNTVQRTAPQVTAAEAIGIALGAADGRVRAMDLDTERGVVVWEVEVVGTRGGTELYIDATSGEVVKQERT